MLERYDELIESANERSRLVRPRSRGTRVLQPRGVVLLKSTFRQNSRVFNYFLSTRLPEVLVLQASPILGCWLALPELSRSVLLPVSFLFLGSFALTAQIFLFNDLVENELDAQDARRARFLFSCQGIERIEVVRALIALLIFAFAAFAAIGGLAVFLGFAIGALGLLYSSSSFGKRSAVMGSLNHLLGGVLHFLLGYTVFHPIDENGLLLGSFFVLVFAGGHLNQEVRDFETDRLNGIRTNAVAFGRQRAFYASMCLFSAAYLLIFSLASWGLLPRIFLLSLVPWMLHLAFSLQAIRRGLSSETSLWLQRRYRLLFAVIGAMIFISPFLRE